MRSIVLNVLWTIATTSADCLSTTNASTTQYSSSTSDSDDFNVPEFKIKSVLKLSGLQEKIFNLKYLRFFFTEEEEENHHISFKVDEGQPNLEELAELVEIEIESSEHGSIPVGDRFFLPSYQGLLNKDNWSETKHLSIENFKKMKREFTLKGKVILQRFAETQEVSEFENNVRKYSLSNQQDKVFPAVNYKKKNWTKS